MASRRRRTFREEKISALLKVPDNPDGPLTSEEYAESVLIDRFVHGSACQALRDNIARLAQTGPSMRSMGKNFFCDNSSVTNTGRVARRAAKAAGDAVEGYVTVEVRMPKSVAATLRYIERTTAEAEDRKPRSLKQVISIAIVGYGIAAFDALTTNPTVFPFFRRAWNRLCRREGVASKYKMDGPLFPIWSSPGALPGTYGSSLYSCIPPPEGWPPLLDDEEPSDGTE